jgi:hypothetical protein
MITMAADRKTVKKFDNRTGSTMKTAFQVKNRVGQILGSAVRTSFDKYQEAANASDKSQG